MIDVFCIVRYDSSNGVYFVTICTYDANKH